MLNVQKTQLEYFCDLVKKIFFVKKQEFTLIEIIIQLV